MAKIKVYADIKEVNRYFFTVEVDDRLSEKEREIMGVAKVASHLLENSPSPESCNNNITSDVRCTDRESARDTLEPIKIEINE
jgi:hypothetical protein